MSKKILIGGIAIIAFASLFFFLKSETVPPEILEVSQIDSVQVEAPIPTLLYGFPIDSFDIVAEKVKRNQNISEILLSYNISMGLIDEIAKKSKKVFDVRKFKANQPYTIICEKDSLKTARQFIYESSQLEYVVYDLVDSISIHKYEKEIRLQERVVTGVIKSSLYETLEDTGFGAILTNSLADVFAWQVDFFRINKGDLFKVIFEEQVVDDEVVGIEKITGAYFEHYGKPYYAVYFNQGEGADYFDEDGNSLRKAFLKTPLNFTRISSRYSGRRFHPVLKTYRPHLGTDYVAALGTPIRSVGEGVITEATYKSNNGNYVKIRHNSTYSTQYLHMSKIASGIRPGVTVKQGQTIGFVGKTGLATGPHLCFRFWKNGRQVDAMKVELPPSEPIRDEYAAAYGQHSTIMINKLDNINIQKPTETVIASIGGK
ncbi:MAG: peptidoglycan DD-metalloendopeptidase family protein [Bacteroidetes bacterium]|nr:peptidoglycan DD-metalloendopeptidase family protein [Bacteroidota bacterium]MDA1119062.1 peptidoglycan DD-metalloendopeptidase family protein [Bacteroidota bacterium]